MIKSIAHMITSIKTFVINLCINFWWVIFFAILCFMLFEQGIKKRNKDFQNLSQRLIELQIDKESAISLRQDLHLQINSQSDPAWVELILMKGLGLAPEGQTKVFFTKEPGKRNSQ